MKAFYTLILVLIAGTAYGQSNLPACQGSDASKWSNCFGSWTYSNGNKYLGEWKNGANNGQGTYYFLADNQFKGDKHVGEYKASKRNGRGTYISSNGDKYVGEYKDNEPNGQGTETFADGSKFVGEFKDGKRNGRGTYTYSNGDKYVGEYKDDKPNGQGTYTSSNGDKYVGEWKDGKKKVGEWSITDQGCKVWNPSPLKGETVTWSGLCKDGFGFGYGEEQWYLNGKDGNKLIGTQDQGEFISGEIEIYLPADIKNSSIHLAKTYFGGFINHRREGLGLEIFENGDKFQGEFQNNRRSGKGVFKYSDGRIQEGIWESGNFVREEKINSSAIFEKDSKANEELRKINAARQKLDQERLRLDEDKRQREQAKQSNRISINASATQPDSSGVVTINIQTNTDTSSLKINGEELGGKVDGSYSVRRVARVGQETKFILAATDVYGNTDTKSITVSRTVVESKVTYQQLNPDRIKRQPERDAVAVIIGISNYKSLPKAEFAKDDAQVFYDYAIRALGVKPGNIKLLMDEQADAEEIYTAFKTWLPARVKSTTDVYVFYSGHGLPTQDGSGLYWLPQRANRDLISKTGILLSEVNNDIQASKPKSVTIFMDACYSGQARGGETLVASARPIALKSQPTTFPSNFTVISASQADQISSSSPELQHGIFSYYLMRGMEGEADLNKDGKITLDEIQKYLSENVGRQARIMNRQQEPQVIGDGATVLVGSKQK